MSQPAVQYEPTRASIQAHKTPEWYHDAKFGIFIHWGPFSIPAYAPLGHGDVNQLLANEGYRSFFANIPYSEWYINSIRIKGSPAYEHHRRAYGGQASYFDFAQQFKRAAASWEPGPWVDLFQAAGARYVVMVTKHMDGFLMWPSKTPNYALPDYQMDRDIVGELADAVKARDMRMGVYYSSALDQSFTTSAMTDIVGLMSEGGPIDKRYATYQLSHWRELIDRYQPSVLWGDIAYPPRTNLFDLFAHFYNQIPDGVVNDRWGQLPSWAHRLARTRPVRALLNRYGTRILRQGAAGNVKPAHYDVRTPEFTVMKDIRAEKWETCRGMGSGFGYNREEQEDDYINLPDLIHMLVDIVSKNGNLLLNVGPMPDGTIPSVQADLLRGVGAWLQTYGEAIYGTRPWHRAEGATAAGGRVRFTKRTSPTDETIYALFLDPIEGSNVTIRDLQVGEGAVARDVATGMPLGLHRDRDDLTLSLQGAFPDAIVHAVAITAQGPARPPTIS
jgi:alpha-L-fucosidase